MSYNSVYDTLYNNIKNRFTVENDDGEYTLGDYMLKKAKEKKAATTASNLPVAKARVENRALSAIMSYVNDKLTVKVPPAKDKTFKAFPFRASLTTALSSLLLCTLVFSYGFFAMRSASDSKPDMPSVVEVTEAEENEEISEK